MMKIIRILMKNNNKDNKEYRWWCYLETENK